MFCHIFQTCRFAEISVETCILISVHAIEFFKIVYKEQQTSFFKQKSYNFCSYQVLDQGKMFSSQTLCELAHLITFADVYVDMYNNGVQRKILGCLSCFLI